VWTGITAVAALGAVVTLGASGADAPGAAPGAGDPFARADAVVDLAFEIIVEAELGLADATIVDLQLDLDQNAPLPALTRVAVPIDGRDHVLVLAPFSVRGADYQVLVQDESGATEVADPTPVRTMRGHVEGVDGSRAAASLLEDGLHGLIDLGAAGRVWIEPVGHLVPGGLGTKHVVYRDGDVLPHNGTCGMPDADEARIHGNVVPAGGGATAGGGTCVAELACDADTEYYNTYGSVAATQNRINSVINTVNLQYEAQVGITHQITTILVRTGTDPYTSTDAQTRLCQFITEWTNNQQAIVRDVAHLFTGVELNGGTIGIAADIGGTGICVSQGACTGGTYGTQGSYCLAQSDFNGSFSCATDLTAHELGHLWGAFHCSCPSYTMNPSITCANNFNAGSISSIIAYRDTRTCLSGSCGGGPTPPANDSCTSPTAIASNGQVTFSNVNATPAQGASDPQLPAGSPSCQWQGIPSNTHNTVWFTIVAEDTSLQVQTCNTTAIQDTIIALYDGSCGSLVQVACGEDNCGSSTYMSSICVSGLDPGRTYRIMVGNPGGWSGSTPGTIVMNVACPCPTVGPVAGACCLPGGSCVDFTLSSECAGLGGTFQGAGSRCATVSCPSGGTGACCFADGSCFVTSSTDCAGAGGAYQGSGTTCSPNPCPQPTGACCFVDGTCAAATALNCSAAGGAYQGNGTTCAPNPCPQPTGACCFSGGTCSMLSAANCAASGGTYQGDGTTCSPNPCSAGSTLLLAFTSATALPVIGTVQDEDIAAFDTASGAWSLYFDGSDVGAASFAIDGLAALPSGELLFSFTGPGTVGGVAMDDSDILRFTPTSLGSTTAGTWSMYFDGSDVGLDATAEDVDAVGVLPDGRLVISTLGNPSVTGLSGVRDEDVLLFTHTSLGSVTAGTWSYYIDGSDIGLATTADEDIDAISVLPSGLISLSTLGNFSVTGLSGVNEDVFDFTPTSLGPVTAGSFSAFFIGGLQGVPSGADVTAAEEIP
jgi:hypothetical protein